MPDSEPRPQPGESARRKADGLRRARIRRGGEEAPASAYEEAWHRGAEGERILGEALNRAASSKGVAVLHDLALPGKKSNIDHLVVGPAGVSIVDAKAWTGGVWIGHDTVGQRGRPRHKVMEGMRQQKHRVHSILASAGRDDVPVEGLLCFVHHNKGIPQTKVEWREGIGIGTPTPVADYVTRAGTLSPDDMREIHALLRNAFVVSGGEVGLDLAPPVAYVPTAPPYDATPATATIPWRPKKTPLWRRSRVSRLLIPFMKLTFLLTACVLLAAFSVSLLSSLYDDLQPMSRTALNRQLPQLEELAADRAGGKVRGPRISEAGASFELLYRRGNRCRVRVSVPRILRGQATPELSSVNCSQR